MSSREEIQHRVDVMQAWLDGEEIETLVGCCWANLGDYLTPDGPMFDFCDGEYRIKLKPRELWIYSQNTLFAVFDEDDIKPHDAVKYREVLEE